MNVASGRGEGKREDAIAIWDTGAESCGISKKLAERMGLKPLKWKKVIRYVNGDVREEKVYLVTIFFPTSDIKATLYAFEFGDAAQDVLIGMNIIRNGRFLLEPTEDGGARFTFSI